MMIRVLSMDFKGSDFLSAKQLNRGDIELVMSYAHKLEPVAQKKKTSDLLHGKIMAALFYEPSTRTRMSFETAMQRLGGRTVSVVGMEFSSLSKGETLFDTGKVVENFADVVAMRHPKEGAIEELAGGCNVPVINAGDGAGEHPTQALLDIYTIHKEKGKVDGLTVAMVGDLKFGRTVHSLSLALSHFNDVELVFVSPEGLKMPEHVCRMLKEKGIVYKETESFQEGLERADVVYMTRVQQERFEVSEEYEKYRDLYILDEKIVHEINSEMIIMHPLPRIWEVKADVDQVPGAAYFRQVGNGVAVRMALLCLVLGVKV